MTLRTLDIKSNEGVLYSFLGWGPCRQEISAFEGCKKTNSRTPVHPSLCHEEAKSLHLCYSEKAMRLEPLCLPIFNDAKECLFKGDSSLLNCKEEINELVFCNSEPRQYLDFLKASLPEQKKPKIYDFYKYRAEFDKYA